MSGGLLEVRERVLDVVQGAALLACACEPQIPCLACRARAVLDYIAAAGFRTKRWRNAPGPLTRTVHLAGPVICCREHRPSCPGYIVDRRQTCQLCGEQLCRGRWALFFEVGELVAVLASRGSLAAGLAGLACPATGAPGEIPCTVPPAVYVDPMAVTAA